MELKDMEIELHFSIMLWIGGGSGQQSNTLNDYRICVGYRCVSTLTNTMSNESLFKRILRELLFMIYIYR